MEEDKEEQNRNRTKVVKDRKREIEDGNIYETNMRSKTQVKGDRGGGRQKEKIEVDDKSGGNVKQLHYICMSPISS